MKITFSWEQTYEILCFHVMGRYPLQLLMKICVSSICQPGKISTALDRSFLLWSSAICGKALEFGISKTWSYSHCYCKDVWTLLVTFTVKNQSEEGINKEPIFIKNCISIAFKDVQASSTLKKSVSETEHLPHSSPLPIISCLAPFLFLQTSLCKANLQLFEAWIQIP